MSPAGCKLYLLFTKSLCVGRPWQTLRMALRGGVDLVQWRSKEPDLEGFWACAEICGEFGVPLVVNDDVMLALRSRARGAHVGQDDLPACAARRLLDRQWLGVSCHDLGQLDAAVAAGADYVGMGPCFPTATKCYDEGLDPAWVEAAAGRSPVPVFAIGGITARNLPQLRSLGVAHVAVSAAILRAEDPEAAAAALRARL